MKLTIHTSGPDLVARLLYKVDDGVFGALVPEQEWLHPRKRMREFISRVKEGRDLVVLTWDELVVLVALTAAAEGVAEVEVVYHRDEGDVVLKADGRGALPSWPDPSGFFNERRDVLFSDGPLFGKEASHA